MSGDIIQNYPLGYITAGVSGQPSSSYTPTLQDKITEKRNELLNSGYTSKGNNVYEKKEGTTTITIKINETTGEITTTKQTEQTPSTAQETTELQRFNKEISKTEQAIKSATNPTAKEYLLSHLQELQEARSNLINKGIAYTTPKTVPTFQTSSGFISGKDLKDIRTSTDNLPTYATQNAIEAMGYKAYKDWSESQIKLYESNKLVTSGDIFQAQRKTDAIREQSTGFILPSTPSILQPYSTQAISERAGLTGKWETVGLISPLGEGASPRLPLGKELYIEGKYGIVSTPQVLPQEYLTQVQSQIITHSILTKTLKEVETPTPQYMGGEVTRTIETFGLPPIYGAQKFLSQEGQFAQQVRGASEYAGKGIVDFSESIGRTAYTDFYNIVYSDRAINAILPQEAKTYIELNYKPATISDITTTGIAGIAMGSAIARGALSLYSIGTGAYKVSEGKFGEATVDISLGLLGKKEIKGLLELSKESGTEVLAGTIKTAPSLVSTPVRAMEYVKSEGLLTEYSYKQGYGTGVTYFTKAGIITDITGTNIIKEPVTPTVSDITSTLPYAGYAPKYIYPENIGKLKLKTLYDFEAETVSEVFTDSTGAIVLPERVQPRQVKTILVPEYKPVESSLIIVEGRAVPTEVIQTGTRAETIYNPLKPSSEAMITQFGLVTEPTGKIPILDVSRSPFPKQELSILKTGGDLKLSVLEYSQYLKEKYPGVFSGIEIRPASEMGSARGRAGLTSEGKVYLQIREDILFKEPVLETISPELAEAYKAKGGEDITPLIGKEIYRDVESTLLHELTHVEDYLSIRTKELQGLDVSDIENVMELRAFGEQIRARETEIFDIFTSKPERLYAYSTTSTEPTLARVKAEADIAASQRPLTIKNVDVKVGETSLAYNKLPSSILQEKYIPTETGAVIFELKTGEIQTTIGGFKPLEIKSLAAEPETLFNIANIEPSKTRTTGSFRTVGELPRELPGKPLYTTESVGELYTRGTFQKQVRQELQIEGMYETLAAPEKRVSKSSSEIILQPTSATTPSISKSQTTLDIKGLGAVEEPISLPQQRAGRATPILISRAIQSPRTIQRPTTVLEITPVLETKTFMETKSLLETSQRLNTKTMLEAKSLAETDVKVGIRYETGGKTFMETKQGLEVKQVLETKQMLELKQVLETPSKGKELRTIITTERIKGEEPSTGFGSFPSSKSFGKRFRLFVRKGGKFTAVTVGQDVGALSLKGQDILRQTARASYKITEEGGSIVQLDMPSGFIKSKREAGVIVQPRELRISSRGEKEEITYAGIRAQRKGFKGLKL